VGISTGSFYRTSFFDCIEHIRRGGFTMVEVCSSPSHLDYHDIDAVKAATHRLETLGMEPYSFHAPFAEGIDITSLDQAQRTYSLHELLQAAEAAAAMRARYFVTHPGPEKSLDPTPAERMARMHNAAEVLDAVAARCRHLGVGLVLENMLAHLLFGNMRDMLWITGAINSVSVGACLDTGHAALSRDLYRIMYKLSGNLKLVHANDNYEQNDDHVPPGRGRIDWGRLLAELNQTGFRGGFILELSGDTGDSPEETLHQARQSRRLLRDIGRGIELSSPPTVSLADQPSPD
jgi:sugar phosphate isomerase/epimerase